MNERTNLDINWSLGTPKANPVEQKKASVQNAAIQKMAIYGTPQERRTVSTAQQEGNRLGQTQEVKDLLGLGPVEFSARYGFDEQRDRAAYARDYLDLQDLQDLKNAERSTGDMVRDSAIDAGIMAANTVGGVAALGTNVVDQALGTTLRQHSSQSVIWVWALRTRRQPSMPWAA